MGIFCRGAKVTERGGSSMMDENEFKFWDLVCASERSISSRPETGGTRAEDPGAAV